MISVLVVFNYTAGLHSCVILGGTVRAFLVSVVVSFGETTMCCIRSARGVLDYTAGIHSVFHSGMVRAFSVSVVVIAEAVWTFVILAAA